MKTKDNLISLISVIFIVLVGMAMGGCFAPPVAHDPLADLQMSNGNPALQTLKVGFMGTRDLSEASQFVEKWNTQYFGPGKLPDLSSYEEHFGQFLNSNFKSAVKVSSLQEAQSLNLDLVVLLSLHFDRMAYSRFETAAFSAKVVVVTPTGASVTRVEANASDERRGDYNFEYYSRLIDQALRQVSQNLLNSPPLFQFAQSGASASVPVLAKAGPVAPLVKSDVDDLPAIKAKPNKNSYAIVIGIEEYRQKLPKSDFSIHDAKTVTEYLTKVMGYPEENVVTLLNEHATNVDFAKYFEKWLPNNIEKDSSVFIYYSGHGAPNPKTGDAYLVPYDGDPAFIDQTGYSLKRLYDNLGKLQAKEIVVALDSCFSGAGGRSVLAKGARPLVMTMERTAVPSNVAVLSAASGEQISSTYEEKGHGLFTYFMLKGLKGEGDANGDGKIEIGELFEYIKPQVERTARKTYNNEQSPQLIAPDELIRQRLIER